MKNKKKHLYSWAYFQYDCEQLAKKLKPIKFNFNNIYGVPRGGLIVAVQLSHLLNLPVILDPKKISKNTLIVDDISDTGDTLKRLLRKIKYKHWGIATLWVHPLTKVYPSYFVREKNKEWVVMPWETIKSSKYDKTI